MTSEATDSRQQEMTIIDSEQRRRFDKKKRIIDSRQRGRSERVSRSDGNSNLQGLREEIVQLY
jgi:hypothetical protein